MRALVALFLLASCSVSGTYLSDREEERVRDEIVGHYGDSLAIVNGSHATVDELVLREDGTYGCLVWNGSFDGCSMVVGAGLSEGQWHFDGSTVTFAPQRETTDLIIRFADITAVPVVEGLLLSVGGHSTVLKRSDARLSRNFE